MTDPGTPARGDRHHLAAVHRRHPDRQSRRPQPRAAEVLASVDAVICEDSRRTGRLLAHIGSSGRAPGGDRPDLLVANEHTEVPRIREIVGNSSPGVSGWHSSPTPACRRSRTPDATSSPPPSTTASRWRWCPVRRGLLGAGPQRVGRRAVRVRGVPAPKGRRPERAIAGARPGDPHHRVVRGAPPLAQDPGGPGRGSAEATGRWRWPGR